MKIINVIIRITFVMLMTITIGWLGGFLGSYYNAPSSLFVAMPAMAEAYVLLLCAIIGAVLGFLAGILFNFFLSKSQIFKAIYILAAIFIIECVLTGVFRYMHERQTYWWRYEKKKPKAEINYETYIDLYKNACDKSIGKGCYRMGRCYLGNCGLDKDIDEAKEFFKKACNLGYGRGCMWLSKINQKK